MSRAQASSVQHRSLDRVAPICGDLHQFAQFAARFFKISRKHFHRLAEPPLPAVLEMHLDALECTVEILPSGLGARVSEPAGSRTIQNLRRTPLIRR